MAIHRKSKSNLPAQLVVDSATPLSDAEGLIAALESAIQGRQLMVYYQPQMDTRTGSCEHLEALVRWHHPQHGMISPAVFVPLAERCGLIEDMTRVIMDQVREDMDEWNRCGMPMSVAMNISASFFSDPEVAKRLLEQLHSMSVYAEYLTLELTETAMVENKVLARECLDSLRKLGFKISLDDFGTGHASLAHLLDFPIDEIKIDRSFVQMIGKSEKCLNIVRSVLFLASTLGLDVVAEGIEGREEFRILEDLGCTRFQGYYFSPAVPKLQIGAVVAWRDAA